MPKPVQHNLNFQSVKHFAPSYVIVFGIPICAFVSEILCMTISAVMEFTGKTFNHFWLRQQSQKKKKTDFETVLKNYKIICT